MDDVRVHRLADPRGRRAARRQARHQPLAGARGAAPARARVGGGPSERVVFDGKLVTGAGVSAGIDMALTLAARIAGETVAQAIQLGIEYDPQPPFDAGSPATAPRGGRGAAARPESLRVPGRIRRAPLSAQPPRFSQGRPLTCDCRWPSTDTTPRRSSRAGRPCGRASAPGRCPTSLPPAREGVPAGRWPPVQSRRTPTCWRCFPTPAASRTSAI